MKLHRIINHAQQYGFKKTLKKAILRLITEKSFYQEEKYYNDRDYVKWIKENEPSLIELKEQTKKKFKIMPLISIVVPTYNTPINFLKPMVESVQKQSYQNWELCIADGSTNPKTINYLKELVLTDKRIKLELLESNGGIAVNTNKAIDLATGDFVCLLDHDDTLAPFALFEIVSAINANPNADMLYSDEDKLSYNGKIRSHPHFKPDWSPITIRSYNFVTHLLTLKRSLLNKIGKINSGFEGAQDYDLILRASEHAKQIMHIPKILYHWREHANSTSTNSGSKNYANYSTQRAVNLYLKRKKLPARVIEGPLFASARTIYYLESEPLISIIIPTKNHVDTLRTCISSITNRSTYQNLEIIVVDTGSKEDIVFDYYKSLSDPRIKIINWNRPFNYSAVNNFAAERCGGEYLIFLNNDTEVITAGWIEYLLEYCQQKDIGAVGAKLLYPDNTLQHAGVIIGIGGVAGHSHKHLPENFGGYFGRLSYPINVSAVTAACLMIKRELFQKIGGFDESYPLAFNDVDLCMKITEQNQQIVWTPYAKLYHYESKTRGYEDTPERQARFLKEINRFKAKWKKQLQQGDPFYNKNLSLTKEDYSIKK
ncbi:glycosyltransferase family 2 protein [Candidatus Berkelbacteria bacterium]|nr:glycosyltransferase family 2 protein [Candidatus Berkelbacteria bacterium]